MKIAITFALVLAFAASAAAQTLIVRTDVQAGNVSHTVDFTDKNGLEVYALAYNTTAPEYGIGRIVQIYGKGDTNVYAGGYLADWPGSHAKDELFLQPWFIGTHRYGDVTVKLNLNAYLPLNGGPTVLFSHESSVLYRASKKTQIGIAATCWNQLGATPSLQYGLQLKAEIAPHLNLNAAAYIFGDKPGVCRIKLTRDF